jgi:hypothetical protein
MYNPKTAPAVHVYVELLVSSTLDICLETLVIVDTAALLTAVVNLSTEALLTINEMENDSIRYDIMRSWWK